MRHHIFNDSSPCSYLAINRSAESQFTALASFFLCDQRSSFFMEEESPHSTESLIGKLQELFTDSDNDVGQFCFQEEMIEEVMQELYKEIACSPLPIPLSPTSTPLPSLQPSHAPNAKEGMPGTENGSLHDESDKLVGFGVVEEKKMEEGFEDGEDFDDDEWLARVLSWGQDVDTSDWF